MSVGLTPRAAPGDAGDASGKKKIRIRIDAIADDRRMIILCKQS